MATNSCWRIVTYTVSLIGLFFLAAPLALATDPPKPTGQTAQAQASQQQATYDQAALREQLDQMRHSDDRLLATVHWALGVVDFLAVLLAGFSWYTNFRVYERDKNSLKDELRVFVRQELEKGSHESRTELRQIQDAIDETLKTSGKEFQARLDASQQASQKYAKEIKESLEDKFDHFKYDYFKLQIQFEETNKTPPATRLRTFISFLDLTVEFGWEWAYVEALQRIAALLREGATVSASDLPQLNSILAKIPKDFALQVDAIKNLVTTRLSSF